MQAIILYEYSDKENPHNKIAFVREKYFSKDKSSYTCFVIFFLVDTRGGWKIYRLVY